MKQLGEIVKSQQVGKSLQVFTQNGTESNEISIYTGELTARVIVENAAKIKKSFPTLPIGFYQVFDERLKENNFTDTRLIDAVNHVIDTCVYPQPTIAQFISYDKRIKLYTYSQYCKLCDEGDGKNYLPVKVGNNTSPVWAHINDINEYKLESWKQ